MLSMSQEALTILARVELVAVWVAAVALPSGLIKSYQIRKKRIAIRAYSERVGKLLRARHGLQENYTPAQVKGMTKEWGYSTGYDHYALAMYCDYADFEDYYQGKGKRYNYQTMRREISRCLFHTDTNFSVADGIEAIAQASEKRLAIQRYIKHIGPELRKRYGVQKKYTPEQIKQTVSSSRYSSGYDYYAFALYCSHDDFVDYYKSVGESCDYDSMRSEISDSFGSFRNDTTFDACDVINLSDRIDSAHDAGESSSWWSSSFDSDSGSSSGGYDSYSGND
ncbi:hypothetical protein H6F75_05105 [Nodosilinea sp. FACHB-131]|uniref:DUF6559 family protein n=1 Tax=Cyanophyceae TaxID=3028117 RepID=UPI001686AAF9|nr:DUF6559 family protein [Nodosilinea sp. FACHB-131]MBD1872851.1 hypothetical protein [Nodosilinea sp. FACHB-131]